MYGDQQYQLQNGEQQAAVLSLTRATEIALWSIDLTGIDVEHVCVYCRTRTTRRASPRARRRKCRTTPKAKLLRPRRTPRSEAGASSRASGRAGRPAGGRGTLVPWHARPSSPSPLHLHRCTSQDGYDLGQVIAMYRVQERERERVTCVCACVTRVVACDVLPIYTDGTTNDRRPVSGRQDRIYPASVILFTIIFIFLKLFSPFLTVV